VFFFALPQRADKHDQVSGYYTAEKGYYELILKHSEKFGLNPGSRKKIFDMVKKQDVKAFGADL
jgi:hypothetical protein